MKRVRIMLAWALMPKEFRPFLQKAIIERIDQLEIELRKIAVDAAAVVEDNHGMKK